jgi:hypothetical protein
MRWRVFMNSLERTSARNTLDRLSLATESLGPIMAMVLLIPSSLVLLTLGLTAGFGVATGSWVIPMMAVRALLFVAFVITVVGPLILPTRDSAGVIRLLLLPIRRADLYIAQAAGAIADPWVLLIVPVVAGVAIGLAVGLHFVGAAIALLAGVAFMLIVIGITSLASSTIHLLLRDRRRGDIVMFLLVLVLPMLGIIPQFLVRPDRENGRKLTRAERQALPPTRTEVIFKGVLPYAPSELYNEATVKGAAAPARATLPLAELGAIVLVLHAAGFAAYRRVLDMPVSLGARRAGSFGGLWDRIVPGLSPAASAVAFTQLRLALRTPRGRAMIGSPMLVPILLGAMSYQRGSGLMQLLHGFNGLGLAGVGGAVAILAIMPFALNQFAIDKAGLTRQFLCPISIGELLAGKAAGNAMITAIPSIVCFIAGGLVFPGGSAWYWLALPLGLIAVYLAFTPIAASLSAMFPKVVDLNSIGTRGNAHQAAALLGMLGVAICIAPVAGLALLGGYFQRPPLVALLLGTWALVAYIICRLAFIPVRRLVESRVETLAQYY